MTDLANRIDRPLHYAFAGGSTTNGYSFNMQPPSGYRKIEFQGQWENQSLVLSMSGASMIVHNIISKHDNATVWHENTVNPGSYVDMLTGSGTSGVASGFLHLRADGRWHGLIEGSYTSDSSAPSGGGNYYWFSAQLLINSGGHISPGSIQGQSGSYRWDAWADWRS